MGNFFYCIKQGIKSVFKNRTFSLASIGTITACLFLFGFVYCILVNFQGVMDTLEKSVSVTVFFESGTTEERILEIQKVVELREEVETVKYVSGEEAWEEFKPMYFPDGEEGILTNLDEDNPLIDSSNLQISINDTSKQKELVAYLETIEEVSKVNSMDSVADSFTSISRLVGYISLGIIGILVLVAIFLISNMVMIGITVRKEEIAIMKYIGAKDGFVKAPFVIEGVLIGVIGAAIPLVILYFAYEKAVHYIMNKFTILNSILDFLDVGTVYQTLLPIGLLLGVGIGFIGSFFTIKKHLNV